MKEKSRREELLEIINQRFTDLDQLLLLPLGQFSDEEFEELKQEAIS
ncbi:hypothetical protein ACFP1I_17970 [Dyadobacter subterraneus]|uniref:Uncharacterized protein n=1 Tax=Dyadobacter subterraneus TaxID=2773304 RepID=A0ABR9WGX2_9BACT|nr:hypothetical protein [Dyadobacter subterraneus]MBE9464757.1 hypothetical protein [Dyadobacter subterraneus]